MKDRIPVNIQVAVKHLETLAALHGIGERTRGNGPTSAKILVAKRHLRDGRPLRLICELTTLVGNQIPICECLLTDNIRLSFNISFCRRYSYKSKRRKIGDDDDDDQELEESVRTITALFGQNREARTPPDSGSSEEQPLEARVASISAEIAAALVQAQSRVYEDEEDDEDDDEYGLEVDGPETIGPNTSGIRGDDGLRDGTRILEVEDDDDDSDAFPVPLRTRKGKESFGLVGTKRKR